MELVRMGSSQISVVQLDSRDNFAYTPIVSYINSSQIENFAQQYKMELIIYGVPLSLSLVKTATIPNYSSTTFGVNNGKNGEYCYVLNVIENTKDEDIDNSTPTDPSNKTYTLRGIRFSASFINNRYYFNVAADQSPSVLSIEDYTVFKGVPLAKGSGEELLMYKTDYTIDDISLVNTGSDVADPSTSGEKDLVNMVLGGVPLTAGRIGNEYYLIISEV